jgi:sugar lactone lactonase YvrE
MEAEQITTPVARHGEGPVWSARWGGLRLVDMLEGDVLSVRADGVTRWHVSDVAAAISPRAGGGMVVAIERGFALVDADGGAHRLPQLWADPRVRMNDGGCDPQGRFYCGTYAPAGGTGAALYRLDADGSVTTVMVGVTVSNGLVWSPDGTTAYYIDTATRRIDVFDHEPVAGLVVASRRTLVDCADEPGLPDGMTIDEQGHIWVAFWGASLVRRYDPGGRCDGSITLPVSGVTACAFGGVDLDELYVTTSRLGLADDAEPEAGAVFRVRPGVRGAPVADYAG